MIEALQVTLESPQVLVFKNPKTNQFVFPRQDLRGSQSGAWLVAAVEQTEAMLSTIRLDRPE
ncbi:MAG: hypothetical protein WEE66_02095 [Actinomycetota bacterium]